MDLVTTKARAEYKHLFNKLASEVSLLDISDLIGSLAQHSVTEFIAMTVINLATP
jgi:hypothetical protein